MRALRGSLQFTAFVTLFLLIACTAPTTKFSNIWKDETYQLHPEKILVISAFVDPGQRRLFEEEFVMALKSRGIDGIMSYTVMPEMPTTFLEDKDAIVLKAKEVGADTVIISRPLERERTDWHGAGSIEIYRTYIGSLTEVYDTRSNRMIMNLTAETRVHEDKPRYGQAQAYVKDIVNMMSQHKLF